MWAKVGGVLLQYELSINVVLFENYAIIINRCVCLMSFPKQSNSPAFAPYRSPKSGDFYDQDFRIQQFSRLSLNSHHSISNRSLRSNSSLFISSIPIQILPKKSSDSLSMGSRNRRGSSQLQWRNSALGNNTFLNKSIAGKSSLYHNQLFNMPEDYQPRLHKELSENSCPVGNDETQNIHAFQKHSKVYQEGEGQELGFGREKMRKKFLKTKNLLRNLSSYLHKHIKYNQRCKRFVIKFYLKKHKNSQQPQAESFYQGLVEWTLSLNLANFQEYQKVWSDISCKYTSVYRQICYKYYREDLFCDIQSSRLTSKHIIQEYTPQFIEGLLSPKFFTHFQNE